MARWAAHPVEWSGDGVLSSPVCAPGVSQIARGGLLGATPRGQPWTSAVTLPHERNGLSARRMTVLYTFREPFSVLPRAPRINAQRVARFDP